MEKKKVLGVVGGMGPLATKIFYEMVIEKTAATCDQDHINMIILSDASMPDRTSAILSDDIYALKEKLREDFKLLQNAGAAYGIVTCNTAHYFVNLLKDEIEIPILHMIDETAMHIAKIKPKARVAILATDGTIKTRLYQDALEKNGLEPIVLSPELQKIVMSIIYDYVKAGKAVPDDYFKPVEDSLNCDYALMACTELSCFKKEKNLGDFYIDPMEVICEKAILLCGGKLRSKR